MDPLCPLLDKALGVQSEVISPHVVLCSVTQLCPALSDPMDCSPPGTSVRGAFTILEHKMIEAQKQKLLYANKDFSCIPQEL